MVDARSDVAVSLASGEGAHPAHARPTTCGGREMTSRIPATNTARRGLIRGLAGERETPKKIFPRETIVDCDKLSQVTDVD